MRDWTRVSVFNQAPELDTNCTTVVFQSVGSVEGAHRSTTGIFRQHKDQKQHHEKETDYRFPHRRHHSLSRLCWRQMR
jgi:hypothetical protein